MRNQAAYAHRKVTQIYGSGSELYAPEEVAITLLGDQLKRMRMLDLGVGGGRTTTRFAPLVAEYVGADYSPAMIRICQDRFPALARSGAFKVCDARAMNIFPENHFDFVLFSFNGIDYVSPSDRVRILREIKRVCREGALFVFSSHNLNANVPAKFSARHQRHLPWAAKLLLGGVLFRVLNPHWYFQRRRRDALVINDGAHGFRLRTYYVRPRAQVRQLSELGFRDARVVASDGRALTPEEQETADDAWLHYFCRVQKR